MHGSFQNAHRLLKIVPRINKDGRNYTLQDVTDDLGGIMRPTVHDNLTAGCRLEDGYVPLNSSGKARVVSQ